MSRFGVIADGTSVDSYELCAGSARVRVLSYGGVLASIEVPDRDGTLANVTLGFADLADYLERSPNFGCITGRYANRLAYGRFTLDGTTYQVPPNDGPNALHGGPRGLDKQVWDVERLGTDAVRLSHTSPDGAQGFPGALDVTVTYTLSENLALRIDYSARTDAPTVINLTNHAYFNLGGEGTGDVYDHVVSIEADRYTPTGEGLIPTGEIASLTGTPMDFRRPTAIGERIRDGHPHLVGSRGYDHNYVLREPGPDGMRFAGRVVHPGSGRVLSVQTTEPAMQFYSGNFLDGTLVGPSGRAYRQGDGFAMETQHFPDSPNHPQFPSTVLRPGEEYTSTTVYTFGVE